MTQNKFPSGWNEDKVRRVVTHYEEQTEEEAVAEDIHRQTLLKPGEEYRIFLSHKTQELHLLEDLVDALAGIDIDVYVAERDPWPGLYLYEEKIIPAIGASDCVLALFTASAAQSPDVHQEIGIATGQGIPVVALVEDGIQLGASLASKEVVFFDRNNLLPALQTSYNYFAQQADWKDQIGAKRKHHKGMAIGGLAAIFFLLGLGSKGNSK